MCDFFNLLCPNSICLPVSGKSKGTNEAKSLQMAGTQCSPSVSPLTSQTQLIEKLPVHTKSVLSALWRHRQHNLSVLPTPPPKALSHQPINKACFKEKKGKAEEIPPKKAFNVQEKEAHQSTAVSTGVTIRWGTNPGETALQSQEGGWGVSPGQNTVSIKLPLWIP